MASGNNLKIPPWILILDLAGTLLLALGLYGQFGGDSPLQQAAVPLIIAGALLMLPLVVFLVTRATAGGRR